MAIDEFNGWRKASYSAENGGCAEVGWRKSSYSDANGECVEVGWRKSSYSAANGDCVEVAADQRVIGVRDTKQQGQGITLEFPVRAWQVFIAKAKVGCA
jgi:hypothetical protein